MIRDFFVGLRREWGRFVVGAGRKGIRIPMDWLTKALLQSTSCHRLAGGASARHWTDSVDLRESVLLEQTVHGDGSNQTP